MTTKQQLQNTIDWIDEHERNGHNYKDYYSGGNVVYANIKCYNFIDRDELRNKLPKKYQPFLDKISDEYLNDTEWHLRNDEVDMISDELKYSDDDTATMVTPVGCFGRRGGWYGLTASNYGRDVLETMLEQLELKPADRDYTADDYKRAIKEWQAVQLALETLEKRAKAFDLTEAAYYSLEANEFDTWQAEIDTKKDIATAKRLAKKHGYSIAKIL